MKWIIDSECIVKVKNFIKFIIILEVMVENKCIFFYFYRVLGKFILIIMVFYEC